MDTRWIRSEMVFGAEGIERIKNCRVAVFGIGGVGGFAVEALCRGGIQNFLLIDHDKVSLSNLNRQIIATEKTVGRYKVEVMKERILEIYANAEVSVVKDFFLPGKDDILTGKIDYMIDAVDTVTAKIAIVLLAKQRGIPVISCMGTGNKLQPELLQIADIYETSVCPLAKVMRKELRARNITALKVVYSKEEPKACRLTEEELLLRGEESGRRRIPGSVSFVPPVAGMLLAGEVLKDLAEV